jgi:hypothetical protein
MVDVGWIVLAVGWMISPVLVDGVGLMLTRLVLMLSM